MIDDISKCRLLAEMFSDKGSELATQNKQLWNCFLRRFNDIEAAVRAECVGTCKSFILNHLKLSDVSILSYSVYFMTYFRVFYV